MKISVVIPVFNSEQTISDVTVGVRRALSENNIDHEIILVDDGSKDNSWNVLKDLSTIDTNIITIKLLKNYGQHTANLCGFKFSSGDIIITMDDDLQNPPKEVLKLITKFNEGYDLVYGNFISKKHNLFRRLGSKFISLLNKKIFESSYELPLSNFRAISRALIDRVISEATISPYIPGLILKYAESISSINVEHSKRTMGKSNYTLYKILTLIFDLIFQHSNIPIRLISLLGIFISLLSFIFGTYLVIDNLFISTNQLPGWASLATLISFLSGTILLSLSIIGEYLIRILKQLPDTSLYITTNVINSK